MEIKERGQRGLSRLKAGKLNSDPGGDVEPSQNLSSRGPTPLMRTKGRMPTLYAGISPGEGGYKFKFTKKLLQISRRPFII